MELHAVPKHSRDDSSSSEKLSATLSMNACCSTYSLYYIVYVGDMDRVHSERRVLCQL